MHGLSLIELMVSLTIGLILMVAIVSAYLGSAGASRMAEAQGRMNEDAQAALAILTQQLRMAGNNPRQPNYANAQPKNPVFPAGTYFVRGCDGAFSDITTAADIASLHCSAGSNTQPDSIAVSYEADRFNTVPTTGGAATDCLGQSLPVVSTSTLAWDGSATVATPVTYTVADNRYYIGTSTVITSPSLYCKGNNANSSPQPLVENVEDMQFLYGTAPASGTMTVAGYLRADEVTALAAPVDDPARWARTITVRICVLIRSELPVVADAASARYLPCFETNRNNTVAAPDLRLRRAYITTVVLRNRLAAP
jgi:type IV pilus assembly protein PilW